MKKKCIYRNRFLKDSRKQYKRKIRIYPAFLYRRLDKWLKSMSLKGWHIVHCGIFSFLFEKGDPVEKEYFTYGLSTQEGKYSIAMRYPFLEKTYGLEKGKSKINANKSKAHQIVEIDTNKIDVDHDAAYNELISDRNHLYLRKFMRDFGVISIGVSILIILLIIGF